MNCPKIDCPYNLGSTYIADCTKCESSMVLSGLNKLAWKAVCVDCNFAINICENAYNVETTYEYCECTSMKLRATYADKEIVACPFCVEKLEENKKVLIS